MTSRTELNNIPNHCDLNPSTAFKLRQPGGFDRGHNEAGLTQWRQQDKTAVDDSHHETTQLLIEAASCGSTLSLYYQGGSDRGRFRKFSPIHVFRIPDSSVTYVSGYCHLRRAHRTLRTDRISLA